MEIVGALSGVSMRGDGITQAISQRLNRAEVTDADPVGARRSSPTARDSEDAWLGPLLACDR
ncbi:hypothetical protein [Nocardia sp. XZ_19_231]|uniref:hypothetical protein n=1 Tax=Nocardia sp. XZ_19_231 TaxID=2769252 RepID=UPI00188FB4C9|nr:hypothetical protein [Nocardia sp. XZ_19_231]